MEEQVKQLKGPSANDCAEAGTWFQVPKHIFGWLDKDEARIWVYLWLRRNRLPANDYRVEARFTVIAKELDFDKGTVSRAVQSLEEAGALVVHRGAGTDGTNIFEFPLEFSSVAHAQLSRGRVAPAQRRVAPAQQRVAPAQPSNNDEEGEEGKNKYHHQPPPPKIGAKSDPSHVRTEKSGGGGDVVAFLTGKKIWRHVARKAAKHITLAEAQEHWKEILDEPNPRKRVKLFAGRIREILEDAAGDH